MHWYFSFFCHTITTNECTNDLVMHLFFPSGVLIVTSQCPDNPCVHWGHCMFGCGTPMKQTLGYSQKSWDYKGIWGRIKVILCVTAAGWIRRNKRIKAQISASFLFPKKHHYERWNGVVGILMWCFKHQKFQALDDSHNYSKIPESGNK